MQISTEDLLRAYRAMCTVREFEERVHKEFATGQVPGFVHLYAGEEASAIGVCMQLDMRDHIASTHRGHGHAIAKGCEVDGMMKEIFGREGGLCKGKGGSMHIADIGKGMLGANGIVGGGPPLACGAALAAKVRKTGGVAVAFFGDGAFNQGTTDCRCSSFWKTTGMRRAPPVHGRSAVTTRCGARRALEFQARAWMAMTFSRSTVRPRRRSIACARVKVLSSCSSNSRATTVISKVTR